VNFRIQLSPALIAALLCAAGWYAFWLFTGQPAAPAPVEPAPVPQVRYLPGGGEAVRAVLSPTLFALPSDQGFSRGIPEDRIDLRLTLEKPQQPARFLPRPLSAAPVVDAAGLLAGLGLPPGPLSVPEAFPAIPPPRTTERIQLFLSPELKARAATAPQLDLSSPGQSGQVRANLSVRTDGTVSRVLFDTPLEDPALLRALLRLRFTPSEKETDGWLDIRFTPASGGTS
jgi:hypothetical protein